MFKDTTCAANAKVLFNGFYELDDEMLRKELYQYEGLGQHEIHVLCVFATRKLDVYTNIIWCI